MPAPVCRVGFGRAVINPKPGVSLAGYFNPRFNTGVLDDLCVRVMLIESGSVTTGFISLDLILVSEQLMDAIRAALRRAALFFCEELPLAATHTHTAPDVGGIINEQHVDAAYRSFVAGRVVEACQAAVADLYPAEILAASVENNPFAFNRRYWMKDGSVVTNPGKRNPDIVKPEGPVDREIQVVAVKRKGQIAGLVANITNHTDTTGGDQVSADWPGHLERRVQELIGAPIPVISLIAPSGNINHFDVSHSGGQTSPEEARRIGEGYAGIVAGLLKDLKPIQPDPVLFDLETVNIPFRKITEAQLAEARAVVAQAAQAGQGDLTSEDLAKGNLAVKKFFAEQLIEYAKRATPQGRDFDLAAIRLGQDLAIVFLPGEPFTEIGMAIKKASPFRHTLVSSLSNGECGYVPMKECFARGGYEILPVVGGGPAEDTCDVFIKVGRELLTRPVDEKAVRERQKRRAKR
ncbi:MAG TPA: hypothetical protein P5137_07465 [Candidatus Brocadiia bacterium]|nr:hypothetical protein [Candidatus Brocadiia bacterium]